MDLLAPIAAEELLIAAINSGSANGVMDWIMQKFAKNARSYRGLVMMKTKPVAWRKEEEDGDFFLSIMGGDGWEPLYDQSVADQRDKLLQELSYIANADTVEWDDPSEFEAWAKNRARAAIEKIEASK